MSAKGGSFRGSKAAGAPRTRKGYENRLDFWDFGSGWLADRIGPQGKPLPEGKPPSDVGGFFVGAVLSRPIGPARDL